MARVVETVVPAFGERLRWEKVVIKTREGARRFRELGRELGRFPPVPSVVVEGVVTFPLTPSTEELREYLERRVGPVEQPP